MYWRRPLTRLELALYAAIVGVVLAVFLDRLLDTMELAERLAMEATVTRVNSALTVRVAADRLRGRPTRISEVLDRNPFEVAGAAASNSLGELDAPILEDLERGKWVFDRVGRELIYLPRLHRRLQATGSVVRFRLVHRGDGTLALTPVLPYSWGAGI